MSMSESMPSVDVIAWTWNVWRWFFIDSANQSSSNGISTSKALCYVSSGWLPV